MTIADISINDHVLQFFWANYEAFYYVVTMFTWTNESQSA